MAPGNNIDREGLVLFHNYCNAECHDLSGNSADGTVSGSVFQRGLYGWQATGRRGGHITIADLPILDLDAFLIVFCGDFRSAIVGTQYLLDRASVGGVELSIWLSAADTISISDGTDTRTWTVTSAQLAGCRSLGFSKAAGASIPQLYVNSVWHSAASGTINIPSNAQDITILEDYAGANGFQSGVNALTIYNIDKSANIAAIHESLLDLHTPHAGSRRTYSTPSVHANQTGLVAGWNMEKVNGKVVDVKGVNNGTTVGTVLQTRTPWGEPCLDMDGVSGVVTLPAPLNLGTVHTLSAWLRHDADGDIAFGGGANIYSHGRFAPNYWYNSQLSFTNWNWAPGLGIYNHIVIARNGLNVELVANGVSKGFKALGGANSDLLIQYLGKESAAGFFLDGQMCSPKLLNACWTVDDAKAEYNRVASMCLLHIDFESSPTGKVWSAGQMIDGTPILVVSGTWQVVWDSTLGKKVLECVTAGKAKVKPPRGNEAFGTTRWKMLKGADANVSTCYIVATDDTPSSGYSFSFEADESVKMTEVGVGDKFQTAASYIAINTWYECEPARTTEGVTTAFVDDVQVVEDSGANPFTDLTVVTNKAILYDLDAGDRIADIDKLFGVPIP